MAFASELQNSLRNCTARAAFEFAAGQSLEEVLSRHLLAVESTADTAMLTSILLMDADGRRLWHAAAPSLPRSFCEAINGSEIGPAAGSCGTAAFEGRAIYVTDIATDPLWASYRHLALPHGLRACWSTPIHDHEGVLVGTFAIYHPTPRSPTRDEVDAIGMITDHVAQAIQWSRGVQDLGKNESRHDLEARHILRSIAANFEQLADTIQWAIESNPEASLEGLNRARQAAERGAAIARKSMKPH